jgi:hypothetical protein
VTGPALSCWLAQKLGVWATDASADYEWCGCGTPVYGVSIQDGGERCRDCWQWRFLTELQGPAWAVKLAGWLGVRP